VNEICHDIKKLDYAKTHLQASITSLKRLQMLITAVGQLEVRTVRTVMSSLVLSGIHLHFSIAIANLPIIIVFNSRF
jgi:Vps53-like, N-terminal